MMGITAMIHSIRHSRPLIGSVASSWLLVMMVQFSTFATEKFNVNTASFAVKFKNETSCYRIMTVFLLPNERIELQTWANNLPHQLHFMPDKGKLSSQKHDQWLWQAPTIPGIYPVSLVDPAAQDTMRLNMVVLIPFDQLKQGHLNGCYIGDYPEIPSKYADKYEPPVGFVEITEQNQNVWLTPHFQLKQFICKQSGSFPKYAVLQERLLLKLELILETLNRRGLRCQTLAIMSGYRTPYYNKAIGNVPFSRHIFGAAADFYIDEAPLDGQMDDLNHDGKIDIEDARVIFDHIEWLSQQPFYQPFEGGLAIYKKTASHGPFVHVDVRGFRARW